MQEADQRTAGLSWSRLLAAGALVLAGVGIAGWTHRSAPRDGSPAVAAPRALASLPTPAPSPTADPQSVAEWARGRVIRKVPVRRADKVFALTFDDGPWPHSTHAILSILAGYHVKATFFMIGSVLREYPSIGREVRDAGHPIGNHSWSHPMHTRNAVSEITRTDDAIRDILHLRTTFFRPPYGILTNGLARQAMREHYPVLLWSDDPNDWKRPSPGRLARTVIRQASPGGIALMHDGGGDRSHTVEALPVIIETLRARGYRFVTIPELLQMRHLEPPGKKPAHAAHSAQHRKRTLKHHS